MSEKKIVLELSRVVEQFRLFSGLSEEEALPYRGLVQGVLFQIQRKIRPPKPGLEPSAAPDEPENPPAEPSPEEAALEYLCGILSYSQYRLLVPEDAEQSIRTPGLSVTSHRALPSDTLAALRAEAFGMVQGLLADENFCFVSTRPEVQAAEEPAQPENPDPPPDQEVTHEA